MEGVAVAAMRPVSALAWKCYFGVTDAIQGVMEHDKVVWFVVAIFVLLALGATVIIGAEVWCFMHAKRSLYAVMKLNPWTFKIGCN